MWLLLWMDGHLSHTSDRVMTTLISKKTTALYFPFHMTNSFYPFDRSCFFIRENSDGRQIAHNFCVGLSPTKAHFFSGLYKHPKIGIQFQNYYRRLEKTYIIRK